MPSACVGTSRGRLRDEQSAQQPVATAPIEKPPSPLLGGSFSSTIRNRYNPGGFFAGDGPVMQGSLTIDVQSGPLSGASAFAWYNQEFGTRGAGGGVNEIDLGASLPLFNVQVGEGSLSARAGAQHWMFPTDLVGTSVSAVDGTLTYSTPGGFSTSILGRHLFPSGSVDRGTYLQLDLSQSTELGPGSLTFGARGGKLFDFFGSDGWFVTPQTSYEIPLNDSLSLRAEGGYQVSDGSMENGGVVGVGITLKF